MPHLSSATHPCRQRNWLINYLHHCVLQCDVTRKVRSHSLLLVALWLLLNDVHFFIAVTIHNWKVGSISLCQQELGGTVTSAAMFCLEIAFSACFKKLCKGTSWLSHQPPPDGSSCWCLPTGVWFKVMTWLGLPLILLPVPWMNTFKAYFRDLSSPISAVLKKSQGNS